MDVRIIESFAAVRLNFIGELDFECFVAHDVIAVVVTRIHDAFVAVAVSRVIAVVGRMENDVVIRRFEINGPKTIRLVDRHVLDDQVVRIAITIALLLHETGAGGALLLAAFFPHSSVKKFLPTTSPALFLFFHRTESREMVGTTAVAWSLKSTVCAAVQSHVVQLVVKIVLEKPCCLIGGGLGSRGWLVTVGRDFEFEEG